MDVKVGQEGVKGQMTCMRREAGHVDEEKDAFLGRIKASSVDLLYFLFQGEE